MIGALAFLGCPWRASFRLAGGDFTAIPGLLGLAGGIAIGVCFPEIRLPPRAQLQNLPGCGAILPALMVGLLHLGGQTCLQRRRAYFFQRERPGGLCMHRCYFTGSRIIDRFLAQRTRFCTMGAVRDVILMKEFSLVKRVRSLIIGAFLTNLAFGQFNPGYTGSHCA
jgi:YedE family putative selenium metabolism protein